MKKRLLTLSILSVFIQAVFVTNLAVAATSITIISPTEGQKISGNSFTVSGNTDPNSTVLIQKGTTTLKQVISDASGNWSADLSNLPNGSNTITSKVIKSTGYGYFASTPDGGGTVKINRLRFSDDAINNGGAPWPVTSSRFILGVVPTPSSSIFYGISGLFNPSARPAKFDVTNPADPIDVSGNYPADAGPNGPAFSSDGSRAYFPNTLIESISVVDVATNAWIKDIPTNGFRPITAYTTPEGKIIVSNQENQGNKTMIIDPATDTVTKTFDTPCTVVSYIFSDDISYPYYYGACINDGIILKLKRTDDSVSGSWNVGNHPTGGYLTPDNSKLYFYSTTLNGEPGSDVITALNTDNGTIANTIKLTGEAVGFLASPDGQKLYVGIPGLGSSFSKNNIDVVDLASNTVSKTITTPESPIAVGFSPAITRDISIDSVSVVLGASTSKVGNLAETGIVVVSAAGLGTLLLTISVYLYVDYRRHKRPLTQADPNVRYTFTHHLHQVSIPLFKYRISLVIKPAKSGRFSKF